MGIINDFLSSYGSSILYTVFTTIISFVGLKIKVIYEKYVEEKIKEEIVENTVKYVEQLYKDLDGVEKLKIAKENILLLLKEKSIKITELELNVLIESFCNNYKN